MNDVVLLILFCIIVVILIVYVFWAIIELAKSIMYTSDRKRMFCSLENTLFSYYQNEDTKECFSEIDLIFKHIIDNDEMLKRYFSNTSILLEKYIICLNANDTKYVNPHVDDKGEYKKYILRLIEDYNKKNPMESIKGANNVLLNQLIDCMRDVKNDKFDEIINQLAIEIKRLQDEVFERDKAKRKQDIISIIGIVLSVVFGTMTVIQFFV